MLREFADWFDEALDGRLEAVGLEETAVRGQGRFQDMAAITTHERWPAGLTLRHAMPGVPLGAYVKTADYVDLLQVVYDRWEPYMAPVYLAVYCPREADGYRFRVFHGREDMSGAPFAPPMMLEDALDRIAEAFVAADPAYDHWLLQLVSTARQRGLMR